MTYDLVEVTFHIPESVSGFTLDGPAQSQFAISVNPMRCGNPICPTGCPEISIGIIMGGNPVEFRYSVGKARKHALEILAACDDLDPKGMQTS